MMKSRRPRSVAPPEVAALRTTRSRAGRGAGALPNLGLVCITAGPEVRFRAMTRTRITALPDEARTAALDDLYRHNLEVLFGAIDYCRARQIRLYRVTSALFPQIDHPAAAPVLAALHETMARFGPYAQQHGVRVVLHPDQFVVLNSESPHVVQNSLGIMRDHARVFDLLGLPASAWSAMILHGGKGGRGEALVETIRQLPQNIRSRLVLENDEYAYGADAILEICRAAGVPMVFDAHHHVVREKLDSYEHESIRNFTRAARETWPDPRWQIVHISNGQRAFADPRHHDVVDAFPSAFRDVEWVEVEAKTKEVAIERLRRQLDRHAGARAATDASIPPV